MAKRRRARQQAANPEHTLSDLPTALLKELLLLLGPDGMELCGRVCRGWRDSMASSPVDFIALCRAWVCDDAPLALLRAWIVDIDHQQPRQQLQTCEWVPVPFRPWGTQRHKVLEAAGVLKPVPQPAAAEEEMVPPQPTAAGTLPAGQLVPRTLLGVALGGGLWRPESMFTLSGPGITEMWFTSASCDGTWSPIHVQGSLSVAQFGAAHQAAPGHMQGTLELVKRLVAALGTDFLNDRRPLSEAAVIWACFLGDKGAVEYLLSVLRVELSDQLRWRCLEAVTYGRHTDMVPWLAARLHQSGTWSLAHIKAGVHLAATWGATDLLQLYFKGARRLTASRFDASTYFQSCPTMAGGLAYGTSWRAQASLEFLIANGTNSTADQVLLTSVEHRYAVGIGCAVGHASAACCKKVLDALVAGPCCWVECVEAFLGSVRDDALPLGGSQAAKVLGLAAARWLALPFRHLLREFSVRSCPDDEDDASFLRRNKAAAHAVVVSAAGNNNVSILQSLDRKGGVLRQLLQQDPQLGRDAITAALSMDRSTGGAAAVYLVKDAKVEVLASDLKSPKALQRDKVRDALQAALKQQQAEKRRQQKQQQQKQKQQPKTKRRRM